MTKEIIFIDTTRNLEFYSDGTSNITKEQILRLKQENNQQIEKFKDTVDGLLKIQYALASTADKYQKALEKINETISDRLWHANTKQLKSIIDEALND